MAKLPYFPLYTSDFISDTIDLTNEEIGAYIRVLMYSWQKGKVRVDKIVRIIGDVEIWEAISHYFVEENGLWFNPRMEKERSKASDKHEKAVVRAKAGADARWNATSNATSNAQAMPTQTSDLIPHNTEPELKKSEKQKRFASPSLDEVIQLFKEKGSTELEAEKFFYFYESKNWMVGKVKMKSWSASVSSWLARNKSKAIEDRGVISTLE